MSYFKAVWPWPIGQARAAAYLGPAARYSKNLYTYQITHHEAFASNFVTSIRKRLITAVNEDLRDITRHIGVMRTS